ncbi:MAG: hypothetical protein ABIB65_02400 [Candidatus Margulisiibacteriota bacterium]
MLPVLLRGGFFAKPNIDYTSNFIRLEGARTEQILALQAAIHKVEPKTINALAQMMREGRSLEQIIDDITSSMKKVEYAGHSLKKTEAKAKSIVVEAEKAKTRLEEMAQNNDLNGAVDQKKQIRLRQLDLAEMNKGFQAQAKKTKGLYDNYQRKLGNVSKLLGLSKNELPAVLAFLQALETTCNFSVIDLNKVAELVEDLSKLSGISLTDSNLVAVVNRSVLMRLIEQAPAAKNDSHLERVAKDNINDLAKHPIILIKSAFPVLEKMDTSSESITSPELLKITEYFSPRYKLESLAFSDVEGVKQKKKDNKQSKAVNLIRMVTASNSPLHKKYKDALGKLLKAMKADNNTYFTRSELDLLREVLTGLKDDNQIWADIYKKIVDEDGHFSFRVRCTRSGLSEADQSKLVKFAEDNPNYTITTLQPLSSFLYGTWGTDDPKEVLEVKLILRRIAKQMADQLPDKKADFNLDLLTFAVEEMKNTGKVTQDIKIPQGVEEHVWMLFRWERLTPEQQTEFKTLLASFRQANKDLETAGKNLKDASARLKEAGKKEKTALEKAARGIELAYNKKRAEAQTIQEKYLKLVNDLKLDGTVGKDDVEAILTAKALESVIPLLDILFLDENGLRTNRREEIRTPEQIRDFVLSQIDKKDGWASLTRDPGEDIEISMAKKVVSYILSIKYFNKVKQGNMLLAPLALLPFASTAKLIATTAMGVAGFVMDKKDEGTETDKVFSLPSWMYNYPGTAQIAALSQGIQSEPNMNLAPQVHFIMAILGIKDQFSIFERIFENGMGKVTEKDITDLLKGMSDRIKKLEAYAVTAIEKKITELPTTQQEIWNKFKASGELPFKLPEGSFELYLQSDRSEAAEHCLQVIQLVMFLLEQEGQIVGRHLQVSNGEHIGLAQVEATLENGVVFRPSNEDQTGRVSAEDAGLEEKDFDFGDFTLDAGRGLLDTTFMFYSMPATFMEMGVQYVKDGLQSIEDYIENGDSLRGKQTAKNYAGLVTGVLSFQHMPLAFMGDFSQLWDEGQYGLATGSFLAVAKFFLDTARMTFFKFNMAREFLMNRPTVGMKAPISFFNWPLHLAYETVGRLAKLGVNLVSSPEKRPQSWLQYPDRFIERLSLLPGEGKEWVLNRRPFTSLASATRPSPRGNVGRFLLSIPKTVLVDGVKEELVGQGLMERFYGWGARNSVFGFNLSADSEMKGALADLDMGIESPGKTARALRKQEIGIDRVSLHKGILLEVERTSDGKIKYQGESAALFHQLKARLETLRTANLNTTVFGENLAVREIRIVDGNETNIEIFEGEGGSKHLRLTLGIELLKQPGAIDLSEASSRLQAAVGDIFDPNAEIEKAAEPRDLKAVEKKIQGMAENIDSLWAKGGTAKTPAERQRQLQRMGKLEKAARKKLPGNFKGLSLNEQIEAMDRPVLEEGGRKISYTEARMLRTRALIHQVTGEIVLTTPQIKGILAMHNGISAQIYTGEGKTIDYAAVHILDAPTKRKLISLTHNNLTAKDNFNKMVKLYKAAGLKAAVAKYTDAGLDVKFAKNQVIYLSMTDLAFIELNNKVSAGGKIVNIPWENGLFRVDEFDFIYLDQGLTPFIMSGGELKATDQKAWRAAYKTARGLAEKTDYSHGEEGARIDEKTFDQKRFYNEKGKAVVWGQLSLEQQKRIMRCIKAKHMELGVDYQVHYLKNGIVVLDTKTGTIAEGSNYSDGLHQALQAKEEIWKGFLGSRITPESATIAQVLAKTLVKKIRHIVASSGTLEQINPILEKMGIQFLDIPTNIPRYKWQNLDNDPKINIQKNLDAIRGMLNKAKGKGEIPLPGRVIQIRGNAGNEGQITKAIQSIGIESNKIGVFIEHDVKMFADNKAKIKAIVEQARADVKLGRPIVVGVDNPKLAAQIFEALKADKDLKKAIKASPLKKKGTDFLAYGKEMSYHQIFECLIESRCAILVTTLAKRATDILTKKEGITLYLPDQEGGSWEGRQKSGRAGRQSASAIIRYFSSPECAIYRGRLGEKGLKFALQKMGIDPAKTKLTPASTYADAMKETDITKLNADTVNELFVSAQASYDQLLFDRWEAGAKMESLLPKPLQEQLDALRNIFAPSNDPQDFKKKCETMVRTELEFLWDGKDSINLEVSGERAALQKAVRKLGKMYNVELTIDIPLTGEYSFSKIAGKMAQQLAPQLFDYDKIEHRNLRDLIGKAYNKFEQNLQTLQDELTKRYHSQGKLVASSDGAAVREKFVAEYAAKFINLVEAFNRQAARTVHKQKKVEAFPLFGKYGKLGRGRSARKVGVDGTGIFTEAGKAAAAPVAYQSEQNRRLAGDGLLLVKQNGRIKLVAPVRGYQMSVELRQALGAMNNFPILSNLADGTMIRYRQNGGPARCDIITDRATGYADQSFAVIGNTIAWEGGGQGFGAIEDLHGREVAEKVRAQRSELFQAPKLSAEQLAEVNDIAKAVGLEEEITSVEELRQIVEYARPKLGLVIEQTSRGVVRGTATIAAVELAADLLGIEDKKARFTFVMGVLETYPRLSNIGGALRGGVFEGKSFVEAMGIKDVPKIEVTMAALKGVGGVLKNIGVAGFLAKGIDALIGFKYDHGHWLRHHLTNIFATTAVMGGAEAIAALKGVRLTGTAVGGALTGVGIVTLLDTGYSLFSSDYRLEVEMRAYEKIQVESVSKGFWGATILRETANALAGSMLRRSTVSDNPAYLLAELRKDFKAGRELRATAISALQRFYMQKVFRDPSELAVKMEFRKLLGKEIEMNETEKRVCAHIEVMHKLHGSKMTAGELKLSVVKAFPGLTLEDVEKITERAEIKSMQLLLSRIHVMNPHDINETFSSINDDLRGMFDKKGLLIEGKAGQLLNWVKKNIKVSQAPNS